MEECIYKMDSQSLRRMHLHPLAVVLLRLPVIAGATIGSIRIGVNTAQSALGHDDWAFRDLDGHWSCQHEVEKKRGSQYILVGRCLGCENVVAG